MAFKEPGNLSQVCKVYIRGVKHEAQGPEAAQQRLQSGPLDGFGKCEGVHRIDILQLFLLIKPPAPISINSTTNEWSNRWWMIIMIILFVFDVCTGLISQQGLSHIPSMCDWDSFRPPGIPSGWKQRGKRNSTDAREMWLNCLVSRLCCSHCLLRWMKSV